MIDPTGCSFIDSTGITVLIEKAHLVASPLIVATSNEQNLRVFEVTGLTTVFAVRDDRTAAVAELQKRLQTR